MDEDAVIAQDRLAHPGCGYSVSVSETCSSRNGDFVCETIKHLQRVCPGKRPETIFSKKTQNSGDPHSHKSDMGGVDLFAGRGGLDGVLGAMPLFGFAEDILDHFFRGAPPGASHSHHDQAILPPHKRASAEAARPKIQGRVVGQVEDI